MFISTLSKHLPAVVDFFGTPPGDSLIEVVYLVESARYHLHNLDKLTTSDVNTPDGFQAGMDFGDDELNTHWKIMVAIVELEAFLTSVKRVLDRSWCCIGDQFGPEVSKVRTLGGAIYNLEKEVRDKDLVNAVKTTSYFFILQKAWEEWGNELTNLRNYIEHQAPLGGRSFGYTEITPDGKVIKLFIPDTIPSSKKMVKKPNLKFETQRLANKYCMDTITKVDDFVQELITNATFLKHLNP